MANPPAAPPAGRVLMVQGTSSHAGKSTLVAALCRLFARAGYSVAPFKPQSDRTSQVVVLGRPWLTTDARAYYARKAELWPVVTGALDRLRAAHDVVVIEGAGSPAEINLAQYDIVNMRVARHADVPVLLVGDIDRGGVFAGLYGTVMLLTAEERAHVRGFVINKFRGDPSLLTPGFAMLEERTGVPTLGVLPYLDLSRLPAEDGLELDERGRFASVAHRDGFPDGETSCGEAMDIVVLRLPRIANLDEFQPLAAEPGVQLRFVRDAAALGEPDMIIIPGTKSTMADLAWLRERELDAAVRARRDAGAPILGICGGYQMLGAAPFTTTARSGRTTADGTTTVDGMVAGTYLHGLLEQAASRRPLLAALAARKGVVLPPAADDDRAVEDAFDRLADAVQEHLDMAAIYEMTGLSTAPAHAG